MPLGAAALAGSSFPIDRNYLAEILHFDGLYENTMDAVSDRDFMVVFLSNAAIVMLHLSRLSEELIIWSSEEFGFIEFDDAFSSGSSMMPQKKNPDVAELTRGKTGRVYGSLLSLLTVLKGLPLCYNRDLQEDKEGLFDTVKTLKRVLAIYTPMIDTMIIKHKNMRVAAHNGFINATDLAEYLVKKGMPFRQAHHIVGQIVQHCLTTQQLLTDLPLEQYLAFSTVFEQDLYQAIDLEQAVNSKTILGSSGKQAINQQLQCAQNKIEITKTWLQIQMKKLAHTLD
jgi:argininosuccinate lyase